MKETFEVDSNHLRDMKFGETQNLRGNVEDEGLREGADRTRGD